jgi:hypothetical protein
MHHGVHEHPVKDGEYQDFKEKTQIFLKKQVKKILRTTKFAIVLEASKELVKELLLHPTGTPEKSFSLKELMLVLDKYKYMSLPYIATK